MKREGLMRWFAKAAILTCTAGSNVASAQTVTFDQERDVPCLGFTIKNYQTSVACSVDASIVADFNRVSPGIESRNDMLLKEICFGHAVNAIGQDKLFAAAKYVELYNSFIVKSRSSMLACNFNGAAGYRIKANETLAKMASLLNSTAANDNVSTAFDLNDLGSILDVAKVNGKYELLKQGYDTLRGISSPPDEDIDQLGSSLNNNILARFAAQAVQDAAQPYEGVATVIVKLQSNFTPGYKPNSQDLRVINMIQNQLPVMIKNIVAASF